MLYPCECENMKWFVDNYKVIQLVGDINTNWMITWLSLEQDSDGKLYKRDLAIKIDYCPFCGANIK